MPTISLIAVRRLDKDGGLREAFREHFAADVVKPNTFPNVSTRLFYNSISIHVG